MKIAGFDIFRFSLSLKSELVIGGERLSQRNGFILRINDESGNVGAGEIAPLIGFSAESLDEARDDVARLRFSVFGAEIPPHLEELSGVFERWIGKLRLCSSVRYGFETAILRLIAHSRKIWVSRLISDTADDTVVSQGLLAGSIQDILDKVNEYHARGWSTFKVKIGRGNVAEDIELLSLIRERVPRDVVIRADANKAWDAETSLLFLSQTKSLGLQYVEEPARTWEELTMVCAAWRQESHAPIAMDENVGRFTPETIPNIPAISTFIIKPSLAGAEASMRLARRAKLFGKRVVFSSPFESAVGFSMTAALAIASHERETAHGFDASSWLLNDIPGVSVSWNEPGFGLGPFTDLESRIQWNELEEVHLD